MEKYPQIRVGGVPEHFNEPWLIGLEKGYFQRSNIDLQWNSIEEGTGMMIKKLKSNELDVIVALTEGLINEISSGESNVILLGTYVQSPLRWSISISSKSNHQSIEDLKGLKFGISRLNSGSHLMSCVLANQYGWKRDEIEFDIKNNFVNLRQSLINDEIDAFIWEYFMQKPFYDRGEIRRVGEILTPWPCFLIASRRDFVDKNIDTLQEMFSVLNVCCDEFHGNQEHSSVMRIVNKFHLTSKDALDWFNSVRIHPTQAIAKSTIETTIDSLIDAGILVDNKSKLNSIEFIDTRLSRIYFDIKSMRLYNKPELLIALRNNLRYAGLSKGLLSYQDLLPYDQNHYYGTEILDLAVQKLGLTTKNKEDNSSKRLIQIGSNLAGCARYIAGKYHLKVLAIELQNDLSQAASELTDRCCLNHLVHHLAGNFLSVAEHLHENSYYSIVSWLTILHFQRDERDELFRKSYNLIQPGGYFYLEDFTRIGQLTNDEHTILQNDVFCNYLSTVDQYSHDLTRFGFKIISIEDLTESWKIFTMNRSKQFHDNRSGLIDIHGEDLYSRLKFFFHSIADLFKNNHVGGIRILAQKPIE